MGWWTTPTTAAPTKGSTVMMSNHARTTGAAMAVAVLFSLAVAAAAGIPAAGAAPRRILVDTDMDTDDLLALLYVLKHNRSEFDVKAITINANEWSDAGHAVNHLYDILYMMGRDDIDVGVGGDGGISGAGDIHPDVGGYQPLIDQGMSTAGGCRYRQAVPLGRSGRLDIDTNSGLRRGFLPQGSRGYRPLRQPTAQRVMADTLSAGPTTVLLLGTHTNLALLLMTHPHLRRNVERVYVSGGAVRVAGNLFTASAANPVADFNFFGDPFAAYQVLHSGVPVTMIPLDATNTIPVTEEFYSEFQRRQSTYEAQYCFRSLDEGYYMWDAFAAGVALSSMRHGETGGGGNEFAELEYMNITVVTSNKPYGARDGSNPFFDGRATPKFGLKEGGVHSGHVQTGIRDAFCLVPGSNRGRCEAVLISGNGWANIASIDIVYDVLHMMGRDDVPVGLGNTTASGNPTLGCKNSFAIPHGSGGFVDSDTLYGLARSLPRSPRRYMSENLDHPERRQPHAYDVWQSVRKQLGPGEKITVLTSGPLTNLANISLSDMDASSVIEVCSFCPLVLRNFERNSDQ
ncbi:hypothetical protein BAE44_0003829 [Dichanthelium oligosanthes]|uniref:Inosine/uridine-preferring nucleoside hydrolase domain-containing protein n=1 Tax=Dichanthelium oligosanthes TaxID=888268 RepID=A0A1E5WCR5_9POAL|nr:hypothetical protein BAE44_0003829 [Dichanthelium oligosanthes]